LQGGDLKSSNSHDPDSVLIIKGAAHYEQVDLVQIEHG